MCHRLTDETLKNEKSDNFIKNLENKIQIYECTVNVIKNSAKG